VDAALGSLVCDADSDADADCVRAMFFNSSETRL
jgi:hypothetical protein